MLNLLNKLRFIHTMAWGPELPQLLRCTKAQRTAGQWEGRNPTVDVLSLRDSGKVRELGWVVELNNVPYSPKDVYVLTPHRNYLPW